MITEEDWLKVKEQLDEFEAKGIYIIGVKPDSEGLASLRLFNLGVVEKRSIALILANVSLKLTEEADAEEKTEEPLIIVPGRPN